MTDAMWDSWIRNSSLFPHLKNLTLLNISCGSCMYPLGGDCLKFRFNDAGLGMILDQVEKGGWL